MKTIGYKANVKWISDDNILLAVSNKYKSYSAKSEILSSFAFREVENTNYMYNDAWFVHMLSITSNDIDDILAIASSMEKNSLSRTNLSHLAGILTQLMKKDDFCAVDIELN